MLIQVAHGYLSPPKNSVSQTILLRLQVLGWPTDASGMVCDTLGPFDLSDITFPELRFRAEVAWQHVAQQSADHIGPVLMVSNGLMWVKLGSSLSFSLVKMQVLFARS